MFFFKAFGAAKDSSKTDLKKVNLPFKAAHNDSTRGWESADGGSDCTLGEPQAVTGSIQAKRAEEDG